MNQDYYPIEDASKKMDCSIEYIKQLITTGQFSVYLHVANLPVIIRYRESYIGRCNVVGVTKIMRSDACHLINDVERKFSPYLCITNKTSFYEWKMDKVYHHGRIYRHNWLPVRFDEFISFSSDKLQSVFLMPELKEIYFVEGEPIDTKEMYRGNILFSEYDEGFGLTEKESIDEFLDGLGDELLFYKPPTFKVDDLRIGSIDLDNIKNTTATRIDSAAASPSKDGSNDILTKKEKKTTQTNRDKQKQNTQKRNAWAQEFMNQLAREYKAKGEFFDKNTLAGVMSELDEFKSVGLGNTDTILRITDFGKTKLSLKI